MLCPASEVLLRHEDEFSSRHILFAGDLQDEYPLQISAAHVQVHTAHFGRWLTLQPKLGQAATFGLTLDAEQLRGIDTLIYYWPKTKQEALMQMTQLLSILPVGIDVFVIGENRAGVRSAETLLAPFGAVHKIDSARRCGLYHFTLQQQAHYSLADWWHSYTLNDLQIHALAGVFSSNELDIGSRILLSTITTPVNGNVLDLGCGAGVIGTQLARNNPDITLTLSDINAMALESARVTAEQNQISATVVASDVFSAFNTQTQGSQPLFDLIISNPPFHDGLSTSYLATETLIKQAPQHLREGGELRIVANAFLPYPDLLDSVFGSHQVIAQTGKFKVYRAVKQTKRGK